VRYIVDILSFLAVALFALNYPIADHILSYSVDHDGCTAIRFSIYALSILSYAICSKLEQTKFSKMMLTIGIGFSVSDCVDRFYYKDANFHLVADITMVVITGLFAVLEYYFPEVLIKIKNNIKLFIQTIFDYLILKIKTIVIYLKR